MIYMTVKVLWNLKLPHNQKEKIKQQTLSSTKLRLCICRSVPYKNNLSKYTTYWYFTDELKFVTVLMNVYFSYIQ